MSRPSEEELRHRMRELRWLLDGGVWPPTACARVGWTVPAAYIAARRRKDPELSRLLSRFDTFKNRAAA